MPVLYGVFLYMGITALNGVQMVDRLLLFIMPMKYQPDYEYLRHVRLSKVNLFTAIQVKNKKKYFIQIPDKLYRCSHSVSCAP
jgi:hypothetical protein